MSLKLVSIESRSRSDRGWSEGKQEAIARGE